MVDLTFLPRSLDALIVVPPVADVRIPSLAAHLLQACGSRAGFAVSVFYGNMAFAARAGLEPYDILCQTDNHLFGERLFAGAAYGLPAMGTDGGGVASDHDVIRRDGPIERRVSFGDLRRLEPLAPDWVAQAGAAIAALDVRLVGFSACYQQTSASVALANTLKRRRPDLTIAIGGPNCRGAMAEGVASLSAAIDVVVRGEGEEAFVSLLRRARENGAPDARVMDGVPAASLDDLPLPAYADYFEQLGRFLPDLDPAHAVLPYECARGCWWGRAHPCTFCGYDSTRVAVRHKSPLVVVNDLVRLKGRYPTHWISMADSAIPRSYWDSLVPALARQPLDLSFVWLARAPLPLADAIRFRQAGVEVVEIGVESFSTRLLARMRKGTTAPDNVEALRHCRIAGLHVFYSLLFGFPGDEISEYEETLALMPLLRHLQPPDGLSPVTLLRFSPYLETPARYGLADLKPAAAYAAAFPPTADIERLAYRWEAAFASESLEQPEAMARVDAEAQAWRDAWLVPGARIPELSIRRCPALGQIGGGLFLLTDTRGLPGCPDALLIDRSQARAALASCTSPDSPAARFARDRKLAVMLDGRHVPLAVAAPDVMSEFADEGGA